LRQVSQMYMIEGRAWSGCLGGRLIDPETRERPPG
jgi:hypothetical protein